jgi:Zn-dependent protease
MFGSWKLQIGSLFGIGIYIHWTFLLLPLFGIFSGAGDALGIGFFLALLVGVFTCVVMHEFGHALTARQFGIGTRDITLYPIGGVARLERMSDKPSEEFWIAVAGPAVNVVIAAFLAVVGIGTIWMLGWEVRHFLEIRPENIVANYLFSLLVVNVALVVFNMMPAFPMDGGRVFRALLSMWLGQLRATRIAVYVGMAVMGLVVCLFVIIPMFMGQGSNPWMIVLAAFVVFAGQQELRMVEYKHRQQQWGYDDDEPVEVFPVRRPRYYGQYDYDRQPPPLPTHSRSGPVYQPAPEPPPLVFQPRISISVWDSKTGRWVSEPPPESPPR